ncbi:exo-alpha-sialidase [Paenibacillus hodogayensis]|uniref:Exo-alpha-sialidase n=1 Tax=Paenibacillus hodogayensis TaxID=279208 RepID=A0ABV5W6V5_9BACL
MGRFTRTAVIGLVTFLLSGIVISGPAGAAPPQADDPTVPDVVIVSPENSACLKWDRNKKIDGDERKGNETVPCPWFPSIAKLANGDLYLAYSWSISHSAYSKIAARRSTDNGLTWSEQAIIVSDSIDDKEPSLTVLRNGHILLTYYDYVPSRTHRRQAYIRRSTDNGVTWGPPIIPPTLLYDHPRGYAAINGEMVELDNGDLLMPIYGLRNYDGTMGAFGTYVLRSRDGGYTWLKADERVVMWDGYDYEGYSYETATGYTEPALADLGNGHIMMVARTNRPKGDPNTDVMKVGHSYDYGNTWSTPADEPTLKGHAPHFLKLKGGTHFLTYGDRSNAWTQGRPVIGRMYVDSKGWSYTQSKLLYRNPGVFSDMAYPGSVELDDGRIFTVYYDRGEGILAGTYTRPDPYQLDLWKMFLNGQITYQTDMTHTASSKPMMQPWGPLDGNTSYWYTAASDAGAPPVKYWQLSLDKAYPVTDIGVVLKPGYRESASVDVSVYGSGDWQTVRNYTMQQTDDYDWTALRPERDVKHVRVNITDSRGNGDATFNDLAIRVAPTTFNRSRSLKMDLWQMKRTGKAAIGGNMNALDPTGSHPGLNPAGPIDGKAQSEYAATADCSGCTGTWQVSLDRLYTFNKVGLMLKPGYQESAVVEVSADGTAWTQAAELNMTDTNAIQYLTFSPTTARYVRVRVPQVSSGSPQLTEFELYTTSPMIQP